MSVDVASSHTVPCVSMWCTERVLPAAAGIVQLTIAAIAATENAAELAHPHPSTATKMVLAPAGIEVPRHPEDGTATAMGTHRRSHPTALSKRFRCSSIVRIDVTAVR